MMRRLVQRHHGILPLDTAESIWRVIIATFTLCRRRSRCMPTFPPAMPRCAMPLAFTSASPFRSCPHMGAAGVVAAVSDSKGDLGLVPAFAAAGAGAWWTALEFDTAPKIIARLPFVQRADHPAALPVFVVSRAAAEAMAKEVEMWSVRVSGWSMSAARALSPLAEVIAVPDSAFDGAALLDLGAAGRQLRRYFRGSGQGRRERTLRRPSSARHATRYTVSAADAPPAVTGR